VIRCSHSFAAAAVIVALTALPARNDAQSASTPRSPTTADCAKLRSGVVDHANMDHAAHLAAMKECDTSLPTLPALPGQAAFGAIAEVVRLLEADSTTDWTRVNVEALRQHLIDMDEVTMHAVVASHNVPGGIEMEVTGNGRTVDAIRRMSINHMRMLDQGTMYHTAAAEISNGARITVTAKHDSDARTIAQIRGLGFAGLMTEGDHHAAHHLALARGDADPHGR
jgi:hypothetical protein